MIKIEMDVSNEGARELDEELEQVLGKITDRMARNASQQDARRTTRSYVILRKLQMQLRQRIESQELDFAADRVKKTPRPATVRDARMRRP